MGPRRPFWGPRGLVADGVGPQASRKRIPERPRFRSGHFRGLGASEPSDAAPKSVRRGPGRPPWEAEVAIFMSKVASSNVASNPVVSKSFEAYSNGSSKIFDRLFEHFRSLAASNRALSCISRGPEAPKRAFSRPGGSEASIFEPSEARSVRTEPSGTEERPKKPLRGQSRECVGPAEGSRPLGTYREPRNPDQIKSKSLCNASSIDFFVGAFRWEVPTR